jgi:hypothetical protein
LTAVDRPLVSGNNLTLRYFDAALALRDSHQGNLEILIAQQTGELFSPLYQEDAIRSDQVVEGEGFEFALGIDSVKVDVIEGGLRSAIFVYECESGAGDVVGPSGSEAFRDSFYESCFASAEIAAQENDERGRKFGGKFAAEGDGLICGVSDGFGCHYWGLGWGRTNASVPTQSSVYRL